MNANDVTVIVALLPLAASMVIVQSNPYHALVLRGILGAIAALVYAVLGAADVALTEALVGTMLAITLYAIAVRSSLVMRLGVLADSLSPADVQAPSAAPQSSEALAAQPITTAIRTQLRPYHVRLEVLPYPSHADLEQAFAEEAIHGVWLPTSEVSLSAPASASPPVLVLRIQRLYEILGPELADRGLPVVYHPATSPLTSALLPPLEPPNYEESVP